MIGRETFEVGGIADEDAMVDGQTFFQRSCGNTEALVKAAEHEVGLSGLDADAVNSIKGIAQTYGLSKISAKLREDVEIGLHEPSRSLNG